jgi:hypothetical protein
MWGISLKRERNASVAVCVCVSNTGARLWRRLAMPLRRQKKGRERVGPPAVQPEEHTFFPSHSARRASFHYGKNDTVLSGIGQDRTALRRPAAAAARCVGRARSGRPVTGRGARMTGPRSITGRTIQFFPESERTGPPYGGRPLRPPGAPGEHAAGVR